MGHYRKVIRIGSSRILECHIRMSGLALCHKSMIYTCGNGARSRYVFIKYKGILVKGGIGFDLTRLISLVARPDLINNLHLHPVRNYS